MQKIKIKMPVCGCDRSELIMTEIPTKCSVCGKDFEEQEIEVVGLEGRENEIIR